MIFIPFKYFRYKYSFLATTISFCSSCSCVIGIILLINQYYLAGFIVAIVGGSCFALICRYGNKLNEKALIKKIQKDISFCEMFAEDHPQSKNMCMRLNPQYNIDCIEGNVQPHYDKEYQKLLAKIEKEKEQNG